MSTRLVLLCAGGTASARRGRFPDPAEPLDTGGAAKARGLVLDGPSPHERWCSPARAARDTAAALNLVAGDAPALRDIDHGDWTGKALDALDPLAVADWLADPAAGAPGGESMAQVASRVGSWMDERTGGERRVLAVTHAAVIRAMIAHALAMPVDAALGIDIAPLSTTTLSFHERWRLQELRRP